MSDHAERWGTSAYDPGPDEDAFLVPDPMDEYPFTIRYAPSGDMAHALTREAAQVAAYQLERDHGIQSGSERATISHRPKEDDE